MCCWTICPQNSVVYIVTNYANTYRKMDSSTFCHNVVWLWLVLTVKGIHVEVILLHSKYAFSSTVQHVKHHLHFHRFACLGNINRAPSSKKWNFRTKFCRKFQDTPYVTTVYNYTRTKVPSFCEKIWQFTIQFKKHHCLYHILPPARHLDSLRERGHPFSLPDFYRASLCVARS